MTMVANTEYTEHGPGVVAVPCQEHWRYSRSMLSLIGVQRPMGSKVALVMGMDVTLSLNEIVRDALEGDFEWVWFQSDDHLYDDDSLLRLLDHQLDVVVPLIPKKAPPYGLVIFKDEIGMGDTADGIPIPEYDNFSARELSASGLIKVHAAGSGGMLVKRHVLEDIEPPWFESSSGAYVNDDLEFCRKIRDAGYEIHCDLGVRFGHLSTYVVRADHRNGMMGITLDFGTGDGTNLIWLGDDPRRIAMEQERIRKEEMQPA